MVEQRAVAIRRGLELFEQVGEQRNVILVDLGELVDHVLIAAMVRERVMRLGHADFVVASGAALASQLERNHPRHVGLQRQHLQIKHQPGMLGVGDRHSQRSVHVRSGVVRHSRLGDLDPTLDFADARQVFVHLGAITRPELVLQAGDVGLHAIQEAGLLPQCLALLLGTAHPVHPVEDLARVRLVGQRRGGGGPRETVLVDAGEAVVALPHDVQQLRAEFERG